MFGLIEPHVWGYVKLAWHQFWHDGFLHPTTEHFVDGTLRRLDCECGAVFYDTPDSPRVEVEIIFPDPSKSEHRRIVDDGSFD